MPPAAVQQAQAPPKPGPPPARPAGAPPRPVPAPSPVAATREPTVGQAISDEPLGGPGQGRLDPVCLAALVCGILPLVPATWVLGPMGLKRCHEDPTLRGRWMAVASLVLGIAWCLMGIVGVLVYAWYSS